MGKRTDEYVSGRVNCVVGKGTEFEGTIRARETVRIEGKVTGKIYSEGTLIIGNGGYVDGIIEAVNIYVGGEIHGQIKSSGRIEVHPGGLILGSIETKHLIVDDKAVFQGTCIMLDDDKETVKPETETAKEESTEVPETEEKADAEEVKEQQ